MPAVQINMDWFFLKTYSGDSDLESTDACYDKYDTNL